MPTNEAEALLNAIKQQLAQSLPRARFELLIRPLKAARLSGDVITLSCPNEVLRGWLAQLEGPLEAAASQAAGLPLRVEVEVEAPPEGLAARPGETAAQAVAAAAAGPPPVIEFDARRKPLLSPRFTFEQFVGSGSPFALSSALQVAGAPGGAYNPLTLHGGPGLGKTHLLHAIGQRAHERLGSRVVYATAEKFTNDYIEHVRAGRMAALHSRYRACDVLLLDDLQFLAGKAETAAEFLHTLLALLEAGRQVVVSCDKPPRQLKGLDERLISRLSAGLVCDLQSPGPAARAEIAQRRAALEGAALPADAAQLLAERCGSVRELEGALLRLLAQASFTAAAPTAELAGRVLAELAGTPAPAGRLSVAQLVAAAAAHFNVSEAQLTGKGRSKRVAQARMVVMYLARQYTDLTLAQIGAELGGRDHSTVSHGAGKIAAELAADPYIEQAVSQISRGL